jgi:acyl carrier protein
MSQAALLPEIATVLSSVAGVDPDSVTPEASFARDLGIDSMTTVEVVVATEDRFGVLIPDDEWSRFSTVGDLVAYLESTGVGAPS